MSFSVKDTRRRLPLYYLSIPLAAAIVWIRPQYELLTDDLHLLFLLPAWIALAHLLVGWSYVVTAFSWRKGYALLRSSLAVYGRLGSATHLQAAFGIAIVEEFVFRYGLLFWLTSVLGSPWAGLLVTSVLFSLAHVPTLGRRRASPAKTILRLLDLMLFALVLGGATLVTRSIYPAVVMHALRNYILRCLLISRAEYEALHAKPQSTDSISAR